MAVAGPQRIVCLSAEAADICARLGAWSRVVAVSSFADQRGLDTRPCVGGFKKVDAAAVIAHEPDLVISFSDVQAEISAELIRAGATVLATNQRTLAQISATIRLIAGAIGFAEQGEVLAREFEQHLAELQCVEEPRPRVFFEEWPQPLVAGIAWVGELIELVGGIDLFADRRNPAARDRVVELSEVVAANPQIIIASWCGVPVDVTRIRNRSGFERTDAVRDGQLFEIPSDLLLQPGPRIIEGTRRIREIIADWRKLKRPDA